MYASRPAVGIIDFEGSLRVGRSHPHGVAETGWDRLEGMGRYVPVTRDKKATVSGFWFCINNNVVRTTYVEHIFS